MQNLRLVRLLVLALVVAGGLVLPIMATQSSAQSGRGTVVIHARACESDDVDADSIFEACHDNGVSGIAFTIDNRQPKSTDGNGNVFFKRAIAGDILVTLTEGYDSGQFSSFRAYCTNRYSDGTESGPNEAAVRVSEFPDFYVRLGAGARLTCDFYYIP